MNNQYQHLELLSHELELMQNYRFQEGSSESNMCGKYIGDIINCHEEADKFINSNNKLPDFAFQGLRKEFVGKVKLVNGRLQYL